MIDPDACDWAGGAEPDPGEAWEYHDPHPYRSAAIAAALALGLLGMGWLFSPPPAGEGLGVRAQAVQPGLEIKRSEARR